MGSGQPWGWETVLAAGGLDSDVHKAEVVVATYPAIPDLPLTVRFLYGTGYEGVEVGATLLPEGTTATDAVGMAFKTFTSSDRAGVVPQAEVLSEMGNLTQLVMIRQEWDGEDGLEFTGLDYFIPEVPAEYLFCAQLLPEVPIPGHSVVFYTVSVSMQWYEWDMATGVTTQGQDTFHAPFDNLPFGLNVATLVQHTAASEDTAGVYRNNQVVRDYFDLVGACWREAVVTAYEFAVYDASVRVEAGWENQN
jgi:hypothetical protein